MCKLAFEGRLRLRLFSYILRHLDPVMKERPQFIQSSALANRALGDHVNVSAGSEEEDEIIFGQTHHF